MWRVRQSRVMARHGGVDRGEAIRHPRTASVRDGGPARRSLAGGALDAGTGRGISRDGGIESHLLCARRGAHSESSRSSAGCRSVRWRWRDARSSTDSRAWVRAHRPRRHRDAARMVRGSRRQERRFHALRISDRSLGPARNRRCSGGDCARPPCSRAVRLRRVEDDGSQDEVVIKLTLRGTVWPSPTSISVVNWRYPDFLTSMRCLPAGTCTMKWP